MKKLLLVVLTLTSTLLLHAQGADCLGMEPICTDVGASYPASINTTAEAGNDYDCLLSVPNPAWYYFEVATNGNIDMSLSAGNDIDFVIWGPFPNLAAAQSDCGSLSAGQVVDCSYSSTSNETPSIPGAVAGEVYIMLITNFANVNQNISLTQTGGSGSTDCSIVNPCTITNFTVSVGACNPATNTFDLSGTVEFTDNPTSGQMIVEDCNGNQDIFNVNGGFSSPVNYSITGVAADGAPCDITVYFTDDPTCTQVIPYTNPAPCLPNCFMNYIDVSVGACDPNDNTFDLTGEVQFTDAPTTGNLIIEDCNGNQQVVACPVASPFFYSIPNLPSDGTTNCSVTAYFTADPACTLTTPTYNNPTGCMCSADAGTYSEGTIGNTNSVGPYDLCFGDQLDLTALGDYTAPDDYTGVIAATYDPGIWLLVYDCPPTVTPPTDINTDPCLLGIASTANGAWSIINNAGDGSTLWFVPVTMYSMVDGIYAISINGGDWCYDLGPTYEVTYLEDITTNLVEDCQAGTATVTVSGGQPANDGSNFTASNLVPGSAAFGNTTTGNGGTITVTGLQDGDNYSFDITDGTDCFVTVTGTFVGTEDPSFTYPSNAYCEDEPNPSPTITGVTGGTFASSPAGLSINPVTGVINLGASTPSGPYTVTYTTPDAICFDQATFDITVNPLPIVDGNDVTICAGDMVTLNGTGADTYIWDQGVTNNNAFVGPAVTTTYNVTGTITATGCSNTGTSVVTVNPQQDASFTTTDFCEGTASPAATITGTPGGTFSYSPDPGDGSSVNAASGSITNGVGGTTYTIDYTTPGPCPASMTQTVTVNALPPVDVPDYSVCTGGTVALTATGANTYSWSPATYLSATTGATVNSTPAADIVYTVTGTDANGCVNTDVTTVTVIPNAPINAGPDVTICLGDNTTLTASGGVTYNWQAPISAAGASQVVSPAATTIYTVDGVDAQGCTGTDQVTVTIDPIPTVDPVADEVLCANANTTAVNFTGAVAGTTYDWVNDNPSIGLAAAGSGNIASFTATNSGTTAQVATITITPTANGCVGTPISFTITVNPIPTVDPIADEVLCANANTSAVTFTGAVGGTSYDWVNDNTSIGLAGAGSGNIASFTATNAGATPQVATITVTPTAAGCVGAPESYTITVDPIPTVDPIADEVLCAAANTTTVTFTGAVGGTTYDWVNDNPSIGLAASGSGDIASFTATNAGATQQVATITVTPTANGCVGLPETFTITVDPIPNVDPIADEVLCANANTTAVTFTGATAGTVYNWVNDNTSIGLPGTGTGDIASFTVTNAGATQQVATITVTPTANGCAGLPETFTITVDPIPTVDPIADEVLCANANTTAVNYTGAVAGTTFDWTNDNTSIGLAANGAGNIASFSATNAGATQQVATITVTPTAAGCIGTPESFTITVNPIPTVDPIADEELCAQDNTTAVVFTGAVAGTTFDWVNDNTATGLGANGTGNIGSFTATNAGPGQQVSTVTVTPSAAGCVGLPESYTITVNPLPTATISGTVTVCEGAPDQVITFTGANGTAPYTFTYNLNGGADQTIVSVGAIATITVPSTPVGTYNYNLVSVQDASSTACYQTQVGTATVTVNPNPTPVINGATTYCTGTFSTLSTTVAYTSYVWSTGDVTPTTDVTDADNPITVTVTNAFGCSATSPVFVVTENSVITYNEQVEICQGDVAVIHGNNETVAGVYSQTFILPTGCDSTSIVTLIVNPLPVIDAGLDQTECEGTQIILFAAGAPNIVWDAVPAITNGQLFTQGVGTITYTATGTDGNGCVNTDAVDVTINPTPSVDPIADEVLCNNAATTAVNFTGAVAGTTFDWTNDNTSIGLAGAGTGNIASFTGTNAGSGQSVGTITVVPTAAGCVGPSESFTISIDPTPTVDAVADEVLCNTAATTAVNFTSPVAGTTFDWTNDNTSIGLAGAGSGNIASFVATNAGTTQQVANITITPTANGCVGPAISFTISVDPTPTIDPVADETLCNGVNTTAVNFTSPVAGTTFAWSNNNGSIGLGANGNGNIGSFVANNAGSIADVATITITPTAAGCVGSTESYTITVNPTPTVDAIADEVVCNTSVTTAVNFTGDVAGTTFDWTNDNTGIGLAGGGAGNIASFAGTNPGTTQLTGTITVTPTASGCVGLPESFTISVDPTPTVDPIADEVLCATFNTTAVNFTSPVAGTTYDWTNSNPLIGLATSGSGNIASFVATNAGTTQLVGTITITPTANGCAGPTQSYTISVDPTASVDPIADQLLCNTSNTAAVNFTSPIAGTTFAWTNDNPTIGLAANGNGNIASFVATNGGTTQQVATITITPSATGCVGLPETFTITVDPTPSVDAIADQLLCAGDNTTLVDFNSAVVGATFDWTNDNSSIGLAVAGSGNIAPFIAINSGAAQEVATITVTPTAAGCVGTSESFTISVNPLPTATISGDDEICFGDPAPVITFTGASGTSPYTFTYTMNNGANQTVVSVGNTATVTVPGGVGVYNYSLVSVEDASSTACSQNQTGIATVIVNDLPAVFAGNDFIICEGEGAVLTGSGAQSYSWSSGTGLPVSDGVTFNPIVTDIYTVTGTDGNGCVNTDDITVTVEPLPAVSFTADVTSGCAPLTVTFTNTTAGNLTDCIWTLSNGTVLTGCGSVTTTFPNGGLYDVTLTTTSANGCTSSATYTDYIYVEDDPVASFSASSSEVSTFNTEVHFDNTSTGAVDYLWNFGDESATSTAFEPLHVFPDDGDGTYVIELVAYSPLGCTDTAWQTVTVNEELIFYVPNTFTPDDDDYNETFKAVFTSGYDPFDFTLLIFNRWGEIIWESHDVNVGWDGTYAGVNEVQDGTFTWRIEFKTTRNDERVRVTGHVNVLR